MKADHGKNEQLPPCKGREQDLRGEKRLASGSRLWGQGDREGWTGWEVFPLCQPLLFPLSPSPPLPALLLPLPLICILSLTLLPQPLLSALCLTQVASA